MKERRPLVKENPYLKDSDHLEKMIKRTVISSVAIEGVKIASKDIHFKKDHSKNKS